MTGFDADSKRYLVQIDGNAKSTGVQATNIIPVSQSAQVLDSSSKRKVSCGPGGCSMPKAVKQTSSSGKENACCDDKTMGYPSVGVEAMDDEHEECFLALQQLQKSSKLDDLKNAKTAIEAHFQHEEELFKETGFDDGGKFSKTKSHCQDHRKILAEIDNEMVRCSDSGDNIVSKDFTNSLVSRLEEHTNQYDTQYSTHMQEYYQK